MSEALWASSQRAIATTTDHGIGALSHKPRSNAMTVEWGGWGQRGQRQRGNVAGERPEQVALDGPQGTGARS